jgi:hypothetical protein
MAILKGIQDFSETRIRTSETAEVILSLTKTLKTLTIMEGMVITMMRKVKEMVVCGDEIQVIVIHMRMIMSTNKIHVLLQDEIQVH